MTDPAGGNAGATQASGTESPEEDVWMTSLFGLVDCSSSSGDSVIDSGIGGFGGLYMLEETMTMGFFPLGFSPEGAVASSGDSAGGSGWQGGRDSPRSWAR